MTYTTTKYKGSEIRVSKKKGVGNKYWATAFSGMIVEDGKSRTEALNNAKKKITRAIKSVKR